MKKLIIALVFGLSLANATNLLKYDVFDNEQNIDLKLSFDTPYRGEITQTNEKNLIIVTLKELNAGEKFNHALNSKIGSEFIIAPLNNAVKIELKTTKSLSVSANLSDDKSELMLKFSQSGQSEILPNSTENPSEPSSSHLARNLLIFLVLVLAIVAGLLIARRLKKAKNDDFDDDFFQAFDEKSSENTDEVEYEGIFAELNNEKQNKNEDKNENSKKVENTANFKQELDDFINTDLDNLMPQNSAENESEEPKNQFLNKVFKEPNDEKIEIIKQNKIKDDLQMAILKYKNKKFVLFLGDENVLFTESKTHNVDDLLKKLDDEI